MLKHDDSKLNLKEFNGFKFFELGSEYNNRPSIKIWLDKKIALEVEGEIKLPCRGRVEKTPKGGLVLRPDENFGTFLVWCEAGYRGQSEIKLFEGEASMYEYLIYHSQRGSLGISTGLIVSTKIGQKLTFGWKRTGRLYGDAPEGKALVTITSEGVFVENTDEDVPEDL